MTQSFEITWTPCSKDFDAQTLLLASVCMMIFLLRHGWSRAHITIPRVSPADVCLHPHRNGGNESNTRKRDSASPVVTCCVVLSCVAEDASCTSCSSVKPEWNLSVGFSSKKDIGYAEACFVLWMWQALVPCVWIVMWRFVVKLVVEYDSPLINSFTLWPNVANKVDRRIGGSNPAPSKSVVLEQDRPMGSAVNCLAAAPMCEWMGGWEAFVKSFGVLWRC